MVGKPKPGGKPGKQGKGDPRTGKGAPKQAKGSSPFGGKVKGAQDRGTQSGGSRNLGTGSGGTTTPEIKAGRGVGRRPSKANQDTSPDKDCSDPGRHRVCSRCGFCPGCQGHGPHD